jgi:hypothetical protein
MQLIPACARPDMQPDGRRGEDARRPIEQDACGGGQLHRTAPQLRHNPRGDGSADPPRGNRIRHGLL